MARKTVKNTKSGLNKLPNDKPVVYRYMTEGGKTTYVGSAQKGRVTQRLTEHLQGHKDYVPGATVQIEQFSTIKDARATEARTIARSQPKHNKRGK